MPQVPSQVPKWRRYLRFWRPDVQADVEDELRFHFEARVDDLAARGLAPEDARRVAAEEFGDLDATRRALTEIGARMERRRERGRWWRARAADLRYAVRGLASAPAFTAGVVLTLAVGVAAMGTMYGTMRQLLLDAPPHLADPDRLLRPYFRYDRGDSVRTSDRLSYPFYERLHVGSRTLAGVAAYDAATEVIVGSGPGARSAHATLVSAGFWRTLGTRAALGRLIADDEAHPATGGRVVVLGHAYWRRQFGGDPAAVGATLLVKGRPYRIIGVAPRGFRGLELTDTDLWLPLFADADGERGPVTWHTFASSTNLAFVVRPRPGVATAAVQAELSREHALLLEADRAGRSSRRRAGMRTWVTLAPPTGALGSDGRRRTDATVTVWLVGVAGVLLVVACANVGTLLLLRALRRRREIAVRLALGMSRRRLTALLFTEAAVLALLGGGVAVPVVAGAGPWTRGALLPGMLGERAGVDWPALALCAGAVLVTAVLTGLAPVLQTRRQTALDLREGAQHGATRRSSLFRALLVGQVALSALLLVGAGLFVLSLRRATTLDLGLDAERTLVVRADFADAGRSGRQVVAFYERALERVRAVPGVQHASLAVDAPLRGARGGSLRLRPDADWVMTANGTPFVNYVADDFFDATGMRVVQGRGLLAAERRGSPAIVVNEALAAHLWPGRSPVGECAFLSSNETTCSPIVGVVANARTFRLREQQRLWIYAPLDPADVDDRVLLVRLAPGVGGGAESVRRALHALDPALAYVDAQRLGDVLDPQFRPWRLGATVFTAFGVLAAALAALGLYAALAYAVAQRTREVGVRMALGAAPRAVVRLVLGDGLRTALLGLAVGLTAAVIGGRAVADLLFETSPREPRVLLAVGVLLLSVAVAASVAPTRRAVRVNPTESLRSD